MDENIVSRARDKFRHQRLMHSDFWTSTPLSPDATLNHFDRFHSLLSLAAFEIQDTDMCKRAKITFDGHDADFLSLPQYHEFIGYVAHRKTGEPIVWDRQGEEYMPDSIKEEFFQGSIRDQGVIRGLYKDNQFDYVLTSSGALFKPRASTGLQKVHSSTYYGSEVVDID